MQILRLQSSPRERSNQNPKISWSLTGGGGHGGSALVVAYEKRTTRRDKSKTETNLLHAFPKLRCV